MDFIGDGLRPQRLSCRQQGAVVLHENYLRCIPMFRENQNICDSCV